MFKDYMNFVRASSSHQDTTLLENISQKSCDLTGDEAKRIYLEEVIEVKDPQSVEFSDNVITKTSNSSRRRDKKLVPFSDKELFVTVQNNDVETLRLVLDCCPDKINTLDEFGWSLLMIGCQANAVDTVKELLKRDINTSVRDKAGNSAHSLVINNKNINLADILLAHIQNQNTEIKKKIRKENKREDFLCNICNKIFHNKNEHLSSTIHNINASRGKIIRPSFAIPESNKGFQMMLRVGWDKESGLGRDGCGKRYPIKAEKKLDRKGLGSSKSKDNEQKTTDKHSYRKTSQKTAKNDRAMEINFRREFY